MNKKKAIVLVNVGTPDAPTKSAVRKYLREFLNDKRVIDIPWLARKLLVNGIIIPFRVANSTKIYQQLWTDKGSPLLIYLKGLANKLQARVDDNTKVFPAMRYRNPSIKKVFQEIKKDGYDEVVVFPLFPQYASSTTGTIHEWVMTEVKSWNVIPKVHLVGQFYNHSGFINAFVNRIKEYDPEKYDYILFSYHGLPLRQVEKVHPSNREKTCPCNKTFTSIGKMCYRATCYETTRRIAEKLKLLPQKFGTSFQSRLSKNWLEPFSDKTLINLAQNGIKKVLIVAPAFVADCLETTIELGVEYEELFREHGGEKLTLVESLNDTDAWVDVVAELTK